MPYLILQRKTGIGSGSIDNWLAGNVSAASYDSKSFNAQPTIANTLYIYNGWWDKFGTKFYAATETTTDNWIVQYSASTPWDISTLTYQGKAFSVYGETITSGPPTWVQLSYDGTKMYVGSSVSSGPTTSYVYQYTLSTPYDVTTASYDSKNASFSGPSYGGYSSIDGTKFYRSNFTGGIITEYNFGTPHDISTLSSTGNTFSTGQIIQSMFINPQGTKVYIVAGGTHVRQYTMGTPYNISTASFDNELDQFAITGVNALGVTFKYTNGTKMYISGINSLIYQFSI